MRNLSFTLLVSFFLLSCGSAQNTMEGNSEASTDQTYGFTEKNPIKVGGGENGPLNERNYLNSLTGPNGEKVSFERKGSCCSFQTKNSPFGGGMLDMYEVSYEGKEAVTLYLNMYDKAKVKAPTGFKMR